MLSKSERTKCRRGRRCLGEKKNEWKKMTESFAGGKERKRASGGENKRKMCRGRYVGGRKGGRYGGKCWTKVKSGGDGGSEQKPITQGVKDGQRSPN